MSSDPPRDFASLLSRHLGLVHKVARSYARDAVDREDLTQEIATQLWRAFPRFDPARAFSTWAYRIALNVAMSWLRVELPRRQRAVPYDAAQHELIASAEDAAGHDTLDDGQRILRDFLAQCDALNRALVLLYLDAHSYAEIAEILGISATNVATKINRAKERLRRYAERALIERESEHGTR